MLALRIVLHGLQMLPDALLYMSGLRG